jgi:CDP-glycerol glycerophosphotransferase (TagB/SpsB family)
VSSDGVAERAPRSLRRHVVAAARALDHAVGRQLTRVRVLVDVRTPMNATVLRPVWAILAHDSRIELAFVAEQAATVAEMLAADGVQCTLLQRRDATWKRWDLVLTADAWNHTPLRRCRRRMQFFHGVAGKYDLDNPSRLRAAGLDRFDRVAFINAARMHRYVGAGVVSPDQAVLVGYPKLDDLLNGRWSAADVRTSLKLDPALPTVLFAPTFSVAGALHAAGRDIITTTLATGVNLVVKLHDRSMTPDAHHTGGIDWRAELARFASHPRFALAPGADVAPLLAAADVLITDHSTVGFEFALLDRPIVVYDAPELLAAARIDSEKWRLLRSMADVVRTPSELSSAITCAFAHPELRSQARQEALTLFAWPGHATARALSVVYELLEITPPPTLVRQASFEHDSRPH